MGDNNSVQQIRIFVLETLEKHQTVSHDLLFAKVEKEFSNEGAKEFSNAIEQLRTLDLIGSFDGGYDLIYEITREGVCALTR